MSTTDTRPPETEPAAPDTGAPETPAAPAAAPDTSAAPPADELPGKAPRARRPSRGKTGGTTPAKPRTRTRSTRATRVNIAGGMTDLYVSVGTMLAVIPSGPAKINPELTVTQVAGLSVAENAEACGKAWASLAAENDAVRQALERVLTVSAFGAVITAHMPILLIVGLSTGAVPAQLGAMLAGMNGAEVPAPADPAKAPTA